MFNLFRAECYKLRKGKNLLVCALVMVGMTILLYSLLVMADAISRGDIENGTAGVVVSGGEGIDFSLEGMNAMDVLQQLFAGDFMAILLACFVSIVVANEYGSGAVKNIVGKGYSRSTIFLARFLSVVLGVVLLILFGTAVNLTGAIVVLGKGAFYAGIWRDAGIYMGLQMVLGIALSAIFTLAAEIGRGMAVAISVSIGVTILPSLLFAGLDLVFVRTSFQPSQYWLTNMVESCPLSGFEAGYIGRTVWVSLLWIVAGLAVGIWHFKKADIK